MRQQINAKQQMTPFKLNWETTAEQVIRRDEAPQIKLLQ